MSASPAGSQVRTPSAIRRSSGSCATALARRPAVGAVHLHQPERRDVAADRRLRHLPPLGRERLRQVLLGVDRAGADELEDLEVPLPPVGRHRADLRGRLTAVQRGREARHARRTGAAPARPTGAPRLARAPRLPQAEVAEPAGASGAGRRVARVGGVEATRPAGSPPRPPDRRSGRRFPPPPAASPRRSRARRRRALPHSAPGPRPAAAPPRPSRSASTSVRSSPRISGSFSSWKSR